MIFFRTLLFFAFTAILLQGSIYEDAEDKKTSRWKILNKNALSRVHNIKDLSKKSRVIEFQGEGTKQAYELKIKKTKKKEYWLSWQMKFSEDFVIIVLVQSNIGKHYLVYTPGLFNGHMQYGLGNNATNGKWQTFKRNLYEDISYFDNRVEDISLKSFVVKGKGSIDNILTKKKNVRKIYKQAKSSLSKKLDEKPFIKGLKEEANALPTIKVTGSTLVRLKVGESYVEEGVSAQDKEDGEINVVSMENIDINEVGRYMVLYMATDSHGNMALDKRYVHVGNVQLEETKVSLEESGEEEEKEEEQEEEKKKKNKQEEQIRMWEEALSFRERELALKENNRNKN